MLDRQSEVSIVAAESEGLGLSRCSPDILRSHADELRPLLDLDEPFRANAMPEDIREGTFRKAVRVGIVHHVGEKTRRGKDYYLYRVDPEARSFLQKLDRPGLPCGHRWGIVHATDDADDPFQCPHHACDETYTREELERYRGDDS